MNKEISIGVILVCLGSPHGSIFFWGRLGGYPKLGTGPGEATGGREVVQQPDLTPSTAFHSAHEVPQRSGEQVGTDIYFCVLVNASYP